jgi:hypothetical protein
MQFKNRWVSLPFWAVLIAVLGGPVEAQEAGIAVPRLFFECRGPECDSTYYRTEIPWVIWVRDQQDADVHVIMTSQTTGSGGREYLLDFMGREVNESYEAQSRYQSLPTDTQRERLDGVALSLSLGLATFATEAGFRNVVAVAGLGLAGGNATDAAAQLGVVAADQVEDAWNLWVFRINASGNYNSESSQERRELRTSMNASRVTPTWRQNYSGSYNNRRQEFELSNGVRFVDNRHDWSFSARIVYALAEHWSIGVRSNGGRNTRNNQMRWGQVNPAFEYSFFPYEEETRRSLTAFYEIGPVYRDYFERTLLGKDSELRGEQALTFDFSQRQPWGNASVNLSGSAYLHDRTQNNVSLRGRLSFRITRGLDLNVGASYSRVRDQVFLPGGDLTDEERLLELQTQQTDFEKSLNFGFSYQFGSIFNNVVNNRFPGGR